MVLRFLQLLREYLMLPWLYDYYNFYFSSVLFLGFPGTLWVYLFICLYMVLYKWSWLILVEPALRSGFHWSLGCCPATHGVGQGFESP